MIGKQQMYYVGFCPVCKAGPLTLRTCGSCGKVVILCDECDAVWTSADFTAKPLLGSKGKLPCPECGASLFESSSHWTTEEEIHAADWLQQAIDSGELRIQRGSAFTPEPGTGNNPPIADDSSEE